MKSDIALINIGDELLLGSVADANLQTLAKYLDKIGRYVLEMRVIKDDAKAIIETIKELSCKFNVVFTSGGIGSTHDDITARCLATAFDTQLVFNEDAKYMIESSLKKRGRTYAEMYDKMAMIPEGSVLIQNDISGAPGFKIANIYALAGVPEIFENMIGNVIPTMCKGYFLHVQKIYTSIFEVQIAKDLELIANQYSDVIIGVYPHSNKSYKTEIVIKSTDIDSARICYEQVEVMLAMYSK